MAYEVVWRNVKKVTNVRYTCRNCGTMKNIPVNDREFDSLDEYDVLKNRPHEWVVVVWGTSNKIHTHDTRYVSQYPVYCSEKCLRINAADGFIDNHP